MKNALLIQVKERKGLKIPETTTGEGTTYKPSIPTLFEIPTVLGR